MPGAFASNFTDWMVSIVTREPFLGSYDSYGQPQFGAPQSVQCYLEDRVRMVRDSNGNQKTSTTTLYCFAGPFDVHDRFTMPATFKGPSQPPVLTVSNVNDKDSFSHSEVYL
jgi:hypothetical protein